MRGQGREKGEWDGADQRAWRPETRPDRKSLRHGQQDFFPSWGQSEGAAALICLLDWSYSRWQPPATRGYRALEMWLISPN